MCGYRWLGRQNRAWLLILLAGLAMPAWAARQAVVEMVQMPAWLERAGVSQPLAVDMEVNNGDRIRTGAGARAYLRLAEGSTVKLGEQTVLGFYSRSLNPQRAFKAALDVAQGSFRFTTGAHERRQLSRELSIRVGTTTATVHEADLWGRADPGRDLLCLIEGRIRLSHAGEAFEMAEPSTCFVAAKKPGPVARVAQEELGKWLRQTEVSSGDGATRHGGRWTVLLARADSEREALGVYDKTRAAGYAAEIRPRAAAGGKAGPWIFDVVLARLASGEDALSLAERLHSQLGFPAEPERH